jgi:hypothetical protein
MHFLPCLSTNKTFAAKLMAIPTQDDSNDRVILGQDLMQMLNLNISIQDGTTKVCNCWMEDMMAQLNKQPVTLAEANGTHIKESIGSRNPMQPNCYK